MAASTNTPMAIAMPVRDMILLVMPNCFIMKNEIKIEIGKGRVTMRMLRKCQRKMIWARVTKMISSKSACFSVSMV